MAAARIGRYVYVVGGFERASGQTTAAVERYDIRRDRWRAGAPTCPSGSTTPTAVRTAGASTCTAATRPPRPAERRRGVLLELPPGSATAGAGCAPRRPRAPPTRSRRSAAGCTPPAAPTRPARCARSRSTTSARAAGAAGRASRARRATTRPAWRRGGRFYVLAGRDAATSPTAERYDPRRRALGAGCRRCARRAAGSRRRGWATAASWSSAASSSSRAAPRSAEVELFDPRRRRWSSLPDMRTPRHGLGGRGARPARLRVPGRPDARLRLLERDRVPGRAAPLGRAAYGASRSARCRRRRRPPRWAPRPRRTCAPGPGRVTRPRAAGAPSLASRRSHSRQSEQSGCVNSTTPRAVQATSRGSMRATCRAEIPRSRAESRRSRSPRKSRSRRPAARARPRAA